MEVASTSVPGALLIWRGLHRVSTDLPHFVDVCDKSQYRILSLAKGYRVRERSRCKRRDHPDRRSRTSVCRCLRVRADPTLHLIDRSVSALLVHRFGVTFNIFGRDLPTILDQVLRDHDRAPSLTDDQERAREAAWTRRLTAVGRTVDKKHGTGVTCGARDSGEGGGDSGGE